jgi:hypothetical protein
MLFARNGRPLSAEEYEKYSNEAMETLHDNLEALVEEYSPEGANGWECEYTVSQCRKVIMPPLFLATCFVPGR